MHVYAHVTNESEMHCNGKEGLMEGGERGVGFQMVGVEVEAGVCLQIPHLLLSKVVVRGVMAVGVKVVVVVELIQRKSADIHEVMLAQQIFVPKVRSCSPMV